jgi:hypothetical protein
LGKFVIIKPTSSLPLTESSHPEDIDEEDDQVSSGVPKYLPERGVNGTR